MSSGHLLFTQVDYLDRPAPAQGGFVVLDFRADGSCRGVHTSSAIQQPIDLRAGDEFSHRNKKCRFIRTREWEFPEENYPWFDSARECLDAILDRDTTAPPQT
jgi:hypothetical protein